MLDGYGNEKWDFMDNPWIFVWWTNTINREIKTCCESPFERVPSLQSKLQKNYTISQENDYGFVDQEDTFEVVEIVQEPTEELQDVTLEDKLKFRFLASISFQNPKWIHDLYQHFLFLKSCKIHF